MVSATRDPAFPNFWHTMILFFPTLRKGIMLIVYTWILVKPLTRLIQEYFATNFKELGISGTLGKWIHNFLTGREQFIVVNGTLSQVSYVTSRVGGISPPKQNI